jgi:hypothetical protein
LSVINDPASVGDNIGRDVCPRRFNAQSQNDNRAFDIGGQPQFEQVSQASLFCFAHDRFVAKARVAAQ